MHPDSILGQTIGLNNLTETRSKGVLVTRLHHERRLHGSLSDINHLALRVEQPNLQFVDAPGTRGGIRHVTSQPEFRLGRRAFAIPDSADDLNPVAITREVFRPIAIQGIILTAAGSAMIAVNAIVRRND